MLDLCYSQALSVSLFAFGLPVNSSDFQRFHADLVAAIEAGVPICFENSTGSVGNARQTLTNLQRWQTEVQSKLGDFQVIGPDQWKTLAGLNLAERYLAALETFAATDSMLPVLDGLTARSFARRQLSRALCWPVFYLGLVLVMAIGGMVFFSLRVIPSFQILRRDLVLPAAIQSSDRFDFLTLSPMLIYFLMIVLALFIIAIVLGGFQKFVMACGGHRFVRSRVTATSVGVVPLLLTAGIPLRRAIDIGCDLTAADTRTRQKMEAITDAGANAGFWNGLSGYWWATSNQQLNYLTMSIPLALITTVGGTVGLLYGLAIYGPFIQLITDLTTAGT